MITGRRHRALVLPLLAGVLACAERSPETVPARLDEGYVDAGDEVRLYYQVRGSGPDTLVAIHGGPGLDMGYLAPDLTILDSLYTVIYYDQRGAGRSTLVSDSARVSLGAHLDDLSAIRDAFGLDRMVLFGHSWGAGLAARYVLEHPDHVKALILASSVPLRRTPWMPQFGQNLRAWMDSATLAEMQVLAAAGDTASDPEAACRAYWAVFTRGYMADPHDPAAATRLSGDVCAAPPEAIRNRPVVSRLTWQSIGDHDWREDFRGVDVPVLVLHGEQDPIPIESAREWGDAFPNARFVPVANAGHFPQVEQPEAFVRALRAFLEGTGRPAAQEGFVAAGEGVELRYRVLGSGADTLVVVHGGPGFTMDYFLADLAPLADELTLIFYDQRGTGGSSLVADSAELAAHRFADDLEAVRAHFGLASMNVLGHSWGAGVAALYAQEYPDRLARLLIVGGVPLRQDLLAAGFETMQANRPEDEVARMAELFEARLADPGDVAACRAYYVLWFRPFFTDPAALEQSQGDFCAGTPESLRNKMDHVDRYTMASIAGWDWREAMRDVDVPTLVVHGTDDPIPMRGAEEWAATLPDARLLVLEGVGHFPYLEAPDAFFPAVREFVRGDWPAGARPIGPVR